MELDNVQNDSTLKQALIYIRVSSEEQVDNFSLGTQEEICRREAKHRGFEIVQVFREEGKSAKTITGRPELLKLLDFCKKNKKNIQAIFVYRLDRLSRQTSDYLLIRKRLFDVGIAIISANEPTGNSPTEKLLETILASFAQHDNDVRSERTKNGMRARFLAGLISNHVPLGYLNRSGYAVKDPESFDTLKRGWDLMATGTKSLREMATIITSWGVNMRIQAAQRLFRNKFYMGLLTSEKYPEVVQGQHTPMVSEEQFYKVQAILDGRNVNKLAMPRKSRDNIDFPLRVILRCSKCNAPFTGGWSKYHQYAYYFCRKRCGASSVPVGEVNKEMDTFLKKMSPSEEGLQLYISLLMKTFNLKLAKLNKTKSIADTEINKLYALRQVLVEKNLNGVYSDEIFKQQNTTIEIKIIAARSSKNEALIDQYNIDSIVEFINTKLSDLGQTYANSNLSQLRCLLGTVFLSGIVWSYPGCSNYEISPLYQSIQDGDKQGVTFGDPTRIRTENQELKRLLLYH